MIVHSALLALTLAGGAVAVPADARGCTLDAVDPATTQLWYLAWVGVHLALAATSVALASSSANPGDRDDARVSAATSAIGLVATLVDRPLLLSSEARSSCQSDGLDHLLGALRDEERRPWSWLEHLPNLALGLTAGLWLLLVDHRPAGSALFSAVEGIAVGELQIWTRPAPLAHATARAGPVLTVAPGAFAFTLRF